MMSYLLNKGWKFDKNVNSLSNERFNQLLIDCSNSKNTLTYHVKDKLLVLSRGKIVAVKFDLSGDVHEWNISLPTGFEPFDHKQITEIKKLIKNARKV